jgi:hypothetical protein
MAANNDLSSSHYVLHLSSIPVESQVFQELCDLYAYDTIVDDFTDISSDYYDFAYSPPSIKPNISTHIDLMDDPYT